MWYASKQETNLSAKEYTELTAYYFHDTCEHGDKTHNTRTGEYHICRRDDSYQITRRSLSIGLKIEFGGTANVR